MIPFKLFVSLYFIFPGYVLYTIYSLLLMPRFYAHQGLSRTNIMMELNNNNKTWYKFNAVRFDGLPMNILQSPWPFLVWLESEFR